MSPPSRSPQQRLQALQQANRIRRLRALDKQNIRSRRLDARGVLLDPPSYWQGARVAELLLCVPAVGHTKIQRMLSRQQISPAKTLGGMTLAQRRRLAVELDRYYQG